MNPTQRQMVELLQARMQALGVTQRELARRLGIFEQYVSSVFRGKRNKHDLDKWAAALGVRFVVDVEEITLVEVDEITRASEDEHR